MLMTVALMFGFVLGAFALFGFIVCGSLQDAVRVIAAKPKGATTSVNETPSDNVPTSAESENKKTN